MARIEATEAERQAFRETLRPLLAADSRKFDAVEWTAFFESLSDIPLPLLQQAVMAMTRQVRKFPFRTGDIRAAAEQCRQQLLAANPYERCSDCRDSSGFVTIEDEQGVERVQRCVCFKQYCERLEQLGISGRPLLQLTAGEEERAS